MRRHLLLMATSATAAIVTLAGCGSAGSSGTQAPPSSAAGAGCAPVAGNGLVVLTDDKNLQNTDNVIPAINKKASSPQLIAALDKVSAALDTTKLIALNKAVDIDRKSSKAAATEFITTNNLTAGLAKGSGTITVGAANFSESATLGEIYGQVLTAAGFQGKVDKNGKDPSSSDLTTTVTNLKALGDKVGLVFGQASQAQDQNAFAVTTAFADKYGVKTLSDLAAKCSGAATVLGGPAECPQRPKCQAGLVSVYHFTAGSFSTLDSGGPLTKTALTTGKASVGLVFSSDSSLAAS
jgi:osmoprotectant transport system substrate-binding protein